ncbi:hypothetical protein ASAC_0154 [Acidilobus saccharovorans 345-15]|uniref:DUF2192 domain-containing protein n=1 Tax=Acidilobus saccharovorans (strain DSM 16705 / JCM 18335 / VKM B-2471 / 345-15) TaxID=666510 RepID=D9PZS4_ACIS3|nr:hypothetical protein ASAC_0154 [Acidilobus saccharovorans 345-15]
MNVWNNIISVWDSGQQVDRQGAIELLRREYESLKITPIKGSADPSDLYDKELTSLYVMGKYGMGLDEQYPEQFDSLFNLEIKLEQAASMLIAEGVNAKDKVLMLLGTVDGNTVARILRIGLTKVYFGFADDSHMKQLSDAISAAFPERADDVNRFLKFYSAFKVALAIEQGSVRDRLTKEALKEAVAIQLGRGREAVPSDRYIVKIASEVFKVPGKVLRQIFGGIKEGTGRP